MDVGKRSLPQGVEEADDKYVGRTVRMRRTADGFCLNRLTDQELQLLLQVAL